MWDGVGAMERQSLASHKVVRAWGYVFQLGGLSATEGYALQLAPRDVPRQTFDAEQKMLD